MPLQGCWCRCKVRLLECCFCFGCCQSVVCLLEPDCWCRYQGVMCSLELGWWYCRVLLMQGAAIRVMCVLWSLTPGATAAGRRWGFNYWCRYRQPLQGVAFRVPVSRSLEFGYWYYSIFFEIREGVNPLCWEKRKCPTWVKQIGWKIY